MAHAGDDERELAARISAGDDKQAEAELCRRWFPRVRACARLHVGADDAADLAQEALVVTIRALREGRVEEPERLAAWVSGVCRNLGREWKKGERRRANLVEQLGAAAAMATPAPPTLDRARLTDCLGLLGARDRAVVVLTYFGDRDAAEIARALDMTAGHVRVARHRALAQLSACVGGEP